MENKRKEFFFSELLSEPVRNGVYKPKEFHGYGEKIVNMGELFAYPRLSNIPMKRVNLTEQEKKRLLLSKGDLLFARRSLVAEGAGKCCVVTEVGEDTTFESSIIRARPDVKKVVPSFLFYFFSSPYGKHALDSIRRQVAVAGITGSDLGKLKIPLPPLPEQQAIAHILGTLDDKIELNRRMNETLEGMARALFKSWFVDFDPVRAKAEGSDTGLPQEIDDIFPDEFVDSELGEIPKGWEVKSLDELAKFLNGLALQKYPAENDQEYLPVVKIAQLRSGNTLNSDRASMRVPPDYVVNDGDILFSWSGSLECVVWSGGKGALNQHLFKVTPLESLPRWLCFYAVHLHLPGFRQIAAGKATTMGHIQRRHLSDAKLAVPCRKALDAMNPIFSPMFERSSWQLNIESRSLALLRDTLLPKLISGEIRVEDAEKFLGVRKA